MYCYRCDRSFRTLGALSQHERDSSSHWQCPECDFDGTTWSELLEHLREVGCRIVCEGCNNGDGAHFPNYGAYWDHVEEDNVCTECERHFQSPSNLAAHKLTHQPADYECLCCYRDFTTYGGMIIHLESGACDSGVDIIDLNETAAKCYQWAKYIDAEYRIDMLACIDLSEEYSNKVYPYKCPTCDTVFSKLSGLFQHVESPSCSQTLNDGAIKKLRRYLHNRHT